MKPIKTVNFVESINKTNKNKTLASMLSAINNTELTPERFGAVNLFCNTVDAFQFFSENLETENTIIISSAYKSLIEVLSIYSLVEVGPFSDSEREEKVERAKEIIIMYGAFCLYSELFDTPLKETGDSFETDFLNLDLEEMFQTNHYSYSQVRDMGKELGIIEELRVIHNRLSLDINLSFVNLFGEISLNDYIFGKLHWEIHKYYMLSSKLSSGSSNYFALKENNVQLDSPSNSFMIGEGLFIYPDVIRQAIYLYQMLWPELVLDEE